MATPISVSDARWPAVRNGNIGPYPYNGKLYTFAIAGFSQIDEEFASVMALVSEDDGLNWDYVVSQRGIGMFANYTPGNSTWGNTCDQRTFAVCPHPTIANYIIVAYRGGAEGGPYEVSVFDMDAEVWSGTSDSGVIPVFLVDDMSIGDDGFSHNQSYMSVGMSSGSGKIYVIAPMAYDVSTPPNIPPLIGSRMYYLELTGPILFGEPWGTWSFPATRVPGQILDPALGADTPAGYYPLAMVNGSDGSLHAFLAMGVDVDTSDAERLPGIAHWCIDDGTGSPATAEPTQVVEIGPSNAVNTIWPITADGFFIQPVDLGTTGFACGTFVANGTTGLVFVHGMKNGLNMDQYIVYCPDDTSPSWTSTLFDTVTLDPDGIYPPSWGAGNDEVSTVAFRYPLGRNPEDPQRLMERIFDGEALTLGAETEVVTGDEGFVSFRQPAVVHIASVGSVYATSVGGASGSFSPLPLMGFVGLAAPAPGTTPITPGPYGARTIVKCPNFYDVCLYWEREAYRNMRLLKTHIPNPGRNSAPRFPGADTVVPWDGREFRKQGAILLPAEEEVDTLITSWRVPIGYDGVLWGLAFVYTGVGYLEGSDDLHFRLNIDRRWPQDYGDITNTMGSLSSTFAFQEGIRISSNQSISLFVSLGPGALTRLEPSSRIVGAGDGWIYPRCRTQRKK